MVSSLNGQSMDTQFILFDLSTDRSLRNHYIICTIRISVIEIKVEKYFNEIAGMFR